MLVVNFKPDSGNNLDGSGNYNCLLPATQRCQTDKPKNIHEDLCARDDINMCAFHVSFIIKTTIKTDNSYCEFTLCRALCQVLGARWYRPCLCSHFSTWHVWVHVEDLNIVIGLKFEEFLPIPKPRDRFVSNCPLKQYSSDFRPWSIKGLWH